MAINLEEMRVLAGEGELSEVSPHYKSDAWKQGKNLHVILDMGDDYDESEEQPDAAVEQLGDKLNAILKKVGSKARVTFTMMDIAKGEDDTRMAMTFDFYPKGH